MKFRHFALACLCAYALAAADICSAQTSQKITRVEGIRFNVTDMDRAIKFYTTVLGFKLISRGQTSILSLGHERIELQLSDQSCQNTIHLDGKSNDFWFQHIAIVVNDMAAAYSKLRQMKVTQTSSYPQTIPSWNKAAAGIKAFYFKDPDNHNLELIYFPPGTGEARWHTNNGHRDLFMGIDHTAITVADTARSLRFYRDQMGLIVLGQSESFGPEQKHLNAIFGAHVQITGLRAPIGPGIELLEYITPQDGRSAPNSSCRGDLTLVKTIVSFARSEPSEVLDPDRLVLMSGVGD